VTGVSRSTAPRAAFLLLAALLPALAGCGAAAPASPTAQFNAAVQVNTLRRPVFTLTDTTGRPYDFTARTKGRVTLLYFGYTHCPDECPTTMADIATALRKMPTAVATKITVVFVTTDPERDSTGPLRSWLNRFSTTFIGLTGSDSAVATAQKAAHVEVAQREKGSHGAYTVGHATQVLAYSTDDLDHIVFDPHNGIQDYQHDLTLLAHGKRPPPPDPADLALTGANGLVANVNVISVKLRLTPTGGGEVLATLVNSDGPPDQLTAAEGPAGQHAHITAPAGVPATRQPLDVPLSVQPQTLATSTGYRLTFDQITVPAGRYPTLPVTFHFTHAPDLTLTVPVLR